MISVSANKHVKTNLAGAMGHALDSGRCKKKVDALAAGKGASMGRKQQHERGNVRRQQQRK